MQLSVCCIKNEIDDTFHPFKTVIMDITGDSFTDVFKKFAQDSHCINMYTAK